MTRTDGRVSMGLAGWSHVRRLIDYADRGNAHAAAMLRTIAEGEIARGCAVPEVLAEWLTRPPKKRGRGKPHAAARCATVGAAAAADRAKEAAAWAAFWNIRAGHRTSIGDGDAGPAFVDAAALIAEIYGVHVAATTVRSWYYTRLDSMDRQHARIEAIAAELN